METQTQTFITCQDAFAAHVQSEYNSPKTQTLMIQHIRVFSAWYEAQFNQPLDPGGLTNYDFRLYRKHSLGVEKVKAATWNSRLWALTAFCEWAGFSSVLDGIDQQGQVRGSTQHRSLTNDEYHRLVHAVEINPRRETTEHARIIAVRDWAMVTLMLNGLRVEEVTLLDWDDLTIKERSGTVLVRNGKGSKERMVTLNENTRAAMRAWTEMRGSSATTALFGSAQSARLSTRTIQRTVTDLGAQIAVDDITCHWLRYTFAKRMEQAGAPIEAIRDALGHNSIETTRRYLRSSLEQLQAWVDAAV